MTFSAQPHHALNAVRNTLGTALLLGLLAAPASAQQDPHAGHKMAPVDPHAGHTMAAADPHAGHVVDKMSEIRRTMVDIAPGNTALTRQDGKAVTLRAVLGENKPTVLAFFYTSCTTVCPATSQILSETQDRLGSALRDMRIVSISIDPDYDTPERLRDYAKKFDAQPQWQHYTGTRANSLEVQKTFASYRGDKMNHTSTFFVNGGGKKAWVRLDGFPTAEQLVAELRTQAKK